MRIIPENILRAIAVVHIEIHDRHTLNTMHSARVARGNGGIVEKAKAHGGGCFRMVAGRTRRDKRIVDFARHDFIHRQTRAANGAKGGLQRAG